jgi:hypothetical protein
MSEQPCQHEWACPGALQIAAEGKLVIILPLFCRLCARYSQLCKESHMSDHKHGGSGEAVKSAA